MKGLLTSSALVAAVVTAASTDARACKRLGLMEHVVDPSLLETDHTPPTLVIPPASVDYGDSSQDGCASDCADIGTILIATVATDDMTAPERIGYRFTLEAGDLPPGLTLPDTAVEPNVLNHVALYWNGSAGGPVDFTVQVVAIDHAGNETAPMSLRIRSDASQGCAIARGQSSRSGLAWMMLMALLAFRRRHRRTP